MAMHKRYSGDFLDIRSQTWTCEIWQEASEGYEEVGELDFPADTPLVIEWTRKEKHEVICGSTATLTLVSPGDRTYFDLYTVKPGAIRLDVYRGDSLYWSGMLDPEHASEPYSSGSNYNVTLTFSDFGIMKRLKYNMTGMKTALQILSDALTRSGISYGSVDQSMISLYNGTTRCTLDMLSVRSDNFYDEEGKAMTVSEALEGVLQPLALRMVQRGGVIYVYDLNGIMSGAQPSTIVWASDDQSISVDKTYNNCKVTFSPYAGGDFFAGFEYTGNYSEDIVNLGNDDPSGSLGVECYTYYPSYQQGWDYSNLSFTIFLHDSARGLVSKHASAKYFHTQPLLGGSEEEGVALWFYTGGHGSLESGFPVRKCAQSTPSSSAEVLKTERAYVPKMDSSTAALYRIRIAESILLDARYNPFEDASDYNEADNQEALKDYAVVTVPAKVQLVDASGNVISHYSNKSARQATGTEETIHTIAGNIGSWASGAASDDDCLLFYYSDRWSDVEDIDSTPSVIDGFISNRQACNLAYGRVSASVKSMESGQYIPYPPQSGYLEVSILAGIEVHTLAQIALNWRGGHFEGTGIADLDGIRWMLFGAPGVELVKANATGSAVDDEDVEYSGVINEDAEESLDISTVVGTMPTIVPTARGLLYDAQTGQPVRQLTRAGRTDCPEQLLIGTIFSQYADRADVLTGTMQMRASTVSGPGLLEDNALSGKVLIPLAEAETIRMCEDVIEASELKVEEYISE